MKKILICICFFSSLYGAENCTLQMRASNLYSSVQTQWPLNTSLTIAACGALALYAGYKACAKSLSRIHIEFKFSILPSQEFLQAGKPYVYAAELKKLPSGNKMWSLVANDPIVQRFIPQATKDTKQKPGDCGTPAELYISKHLFSVRNREAVQKEKVSLKSQDTEALPHGMTLVNKSESIGTKSEYTYNVPKENETTFDPLNFFTGSEFLAEKLNFKSFTVSFKVDTKERVSLMGEKDYGFVTKLTIEDSRDSNNNRRSLSDSELETINRAYIKKLYTKNGGTLYEPQKSLYAWYNPLRWLRILLRRS